MNELISVEHNPSPAKLDVLAVDVWPIWEQDVSCFPWTYAKTERCYLLSGEVIVTPDGGEPVTLRRGVLVTFDAGLVCTWDIRKKVKKHYYFPQ
jgi:uncharacterized cupin superfamily protein